VKQLSEQGKSAVFAFAADFLRATVSVDDDAMLIYTTLNTVSAVEALAWISACLKLTHTMPRLLVPELPRSRLSSANSR